MNISFFKVFLILLDMARPENMELTVKDSLNDKNQKSSEEKSHPFYFFVSLEMFFRLLCMLTFWCSFTPHISLTSFFWLFITEHLLCIMLSLFNFASFQLFHPVGEIFDYRHIEGKVEKERTLYPYNNIRMSVFSLTIRYKCVWNKRMIDRKLSGNSDKTVPRKQLLKSSLLLTKKRVLKIR